MSDKEAEDAEQETFSKARMVLLGVELFYFASGRAYTPNEMDPVNKMQINSAQASLINPSSRTKH